MLVVYGNGIHANIGISIFLIQTETQRAVTAYPFDHPWNTVCLLFQPSSPYSRAPWLFHLVTRPIFIQIHLGAPLSVGRGSAGRFASLQAGPLPLIPSRFSDLQRSPFSPLVFHKFCILSSLPGCNVAVSRLYSRTGHQTMDQRIARVFCGFKILLRRSRSR